MELLILFILLLLVYLALTVWVIANQRVFRDRIRKMEHNVAKLADLVSGWDENVSDADVSKDDADISNLVSQATPEEIEQVNQLLAALGLGKD